MMRKRIGRCFRTRRAALSAAWAVMFCFLLPAQAALLDRVIAAVNNDVITLSDLRQAVAFNIAVSGKGAGRQAAAEILEGLVNGKLLLQEAYRLQLVEVTDAEVSAEEERFRSRLGGDAAAARVLSGAGISPARLRRMLGERLVVERFVERKIELYARVSREDVQSYYDEHRDEFPGRRLAEARKEIESLLSRQLAMRQLDDYVAELRARASLFINALEDEDGF